MSHTGQSRLMCPSKECNAVHLDKATMLQLCNRRKIDDPELNVLFQIPILNVIYQLFMLAVAAAASHIHIAPRYLCDLAFSNFLVVCGITCVYTTDYGRTERK